MSIEKIKVPDIGGAENVEVIEICVGVGDLVAIDDSLIVLESEKASMEVPSPVNGIVTAVTVVEGDTLSEGDSFLEIELQSVGGGNVTSDVIEKELILQNEHNTQTANVESDTESGSHSEIESTFVSTKDTLGSVSQSGNKAIETIEIPELGDAENVEVIELCVSVGDVVAEGDSLIVLETDKASMEIPSPKSGTVISIAVKEEDIVRQGMPILSLECGLELKSSTNVESRIQEQLNPTVVVQNERDDSSQIEQKQDPHSNTQPIQVTSDIPSTKSSDSIYAGPAVRRLSREMGVSLDTVEGSGPRGRITKNDIKDYVKKALKVKPGNSNGATLPPIPAVDFTKFGEISIEPLTKIGRLTATNMQRNWLNIPHVTQFDEADVTDLETFRASLKDESMKRQVKITPLPFILKACGAALKANPKFNSSLHADGENVVYKHYIHIGIAVNTPAGLVVPVVTDVDKKSIWELAGETVELAEKAKNRKLTPKQMQGACFTVSSLGNIGGMGFTPIVNAPEVGILGVSKLQTKPVWNGDEFIPRKMLPLSVSYDHRVINGVDAGQFITFLVQALSDIRRLVL